VKSQLVSSPKEKKFEVLVICDEGDQKSGKRINLPIEKDLHVAFSTIVSRVKRDERLVIRFNVQLCCCHGQLAPFPLATCRLLTSLATKRAKLQATILLQLQTRKPYSTDNHSMRDFACFYLNMNDFSYC